MLTRALFLSFVVSLATGAQACDLCAIYNADTALNSSGKGFSLTISEQFIPYRTVQLDGHEFPPSLFDQLYLDRSMTHVVATWNFSPRFGISANLPVVYERFKLFKFIISDIGTEIVPESGEESGIGDLSLVGRCTVFRGSKGKAAVSVNVLAGVKFPTGDAERLDEEVDLLRDMDEFFGADHDHPVVSGVHLRDLALGSGSYDGVFGLTVNSRWERLFCNAQFQYYLRTPGEADYEFGDEWMISGGPGLFLFLSESFTFNLQALATYDKMYPDTVLGRENKNTGMTATYFGPQINLTIGERFSFNAGVDLPVDIDNQGLQNVPDCRIHGGLSWRF